MARITTSVNLKIFPYIEIIKSLSFVESNISAYVPFNVTRKTKIFVCDVYVVQ